MFFLNEPCKSTTSCNTNFFSTDFKDFPSHHKLWVDIPNLSKSRKIQTATDVIVCDVICFSLLESLSFSANQSDVIFSQHDLCKVELVKGTMTSYLLSFYIAKMCLRID